MKMNKLMLHYYIDESHKYNVELKKLVTYCMILLN